MADEQSISTPIAAVACVSMAVMYVVILYAPTVLLRLPHPSSVKDFLLRRFVCAVISSLLSLYLSSLIIPMRNMEFSDFLRVYGVRSDHTWEAVLIPLSLTCLMYSGSLVLKSLELVNSCSHYIESVGGFSFECVKYGFWSFIEQAISLVSNIYSWRAFVVAPLTEEVVFRACMIPLLLCGGFKTNTVIFLCPVFFSLAHLNHMMEVYTKENYNLAKALMVVGIQLSYTLVFGSYASFLFIRTGHLLAPLAAHVCCNFMGLPVVFSRRKGIVSVAFFAGLVGFVLLLFPMSRPDLYNNRTDNCRCWHGYCSWN